MKKDRQNDIVGILFIICVGIALFANFMAKRCMLEENRKLKEQVQISSKK